MGVGRILEELSIDFAFNSLNVSKLKLEVFEDNIQVINLHRKYNFKKIGEKFVNNNKSNLYGVRVVKICTVIVTYNRYELLKECLDSLLNQTYKTDILIVNNASTDGTDIKIKTDGYLKNENIIYKELDKNLGGAGGFSFGVKFALDNNYDYVWLMDDDAEPELNTLEGLIKKY